MKNLRTDTQRFYLGKWWASGVRTCVSGAESVSERFDSILKIFLFMPAEFLPSLSPAAWVMVCVAAFATGMSKAGLAGISMLGVTLTALAMDGMASTGVVLPLLIFADLLAVTTFREHIQWHQIRRLAWPVGVGLVLGWLSMLAMQEHREVFRPLVGGIVLAMLALQLLRQKFPQFDRGLPHSLAFAWGAGILTGLTTMIANAAGPVAGIYLLILALPKSQFISTMAWLFLLVNLAKIPFSLHLGLIHSSSLALNLCQAPFVIAGLFAGKLLVATIPQASFQRLVLILAGASALCLIGIR